MSHSLRILSLLSAIAFLVATGTAVVVLGDYMATTAYYGRVAAGMAQIVDVNLHRLAQGADVALGRATELARAAGGSANLRDESAWRQMRGYLDPIMGSDSIWIVDRHGDVVLESSSFPGETGNVADRAYFAAGRDDTALFIGPAIRSRFTDRIVITLTRGLLDRQGNFDGVVGITVEAEWLATFYALLEPDMRPDIGVFRRDGSVVFANRDLDRLIGMPPPSYATAAAPGILHGLDPEAQLRASLDIPAYDLTVAVRLDTDAALARWRWRTINTAVVAALGALSLFAVMLFGIRSFERERAAIAAARQAASDLAMARHDTLTGLASRGLFFELSTTLVAQAVRRDEAIGVLYIDLDSFKQVNDRLGHDRGDEVLVETARMIARAIRDTDIAGRIGGDEFVVCLTGPSATIDQVLRDVAERIRLGIAAIGDGIACSIGVAQGLAANTDLQALLRQSDGAMRQAKAHGKNQVAAACTTP